jgi:acetyl-CoA carboxylase biotin carboxyl carrier protein
MPESGPSGDGERREDIFNIDRIRRLIDLMKEHDLGEIDLQEDQQRIRLTRHARIAAAAAPAAYAVPTAGTNSIPSAPSATAMPAADEAHVVTIKSPMVGTYYARANPNAKNFVEVGSSVQPDTTVCIIEAMKVFNEIPAEVRGKIVAVLVQNEEAVDFGKPLFKVDTRG